jgi:hypothetical protein
VLLKFLLDVTAEFAKSSSQSNYVFTGICDLAPVGVRVVATDRILRGVHESTSELLTDFVPTVIAKSGELLWRNVSIRGRGWITGQNRDRELALERADMVCKLGKPQVYRPM